MGELKGDRKNYGAFISKMSCEKLSILALTELMKEVLRLSE
jgi:hypothetical protein